MRVNSLEIDVFELTPAVALTRGHRNCEEEEESEEEEPEEGEEEDEEDDEEEDEPEEILWRSSTTFDCDGTMRTIVKGRPNAAVRQMRDASDSVYGEKKAISLAPHIIRKNHKHLALRLYARLFNRLPPRAIIKVLQKTEDNQTSPWLRSLRASLSRAGCGETRTIVLNNPVTTAERNSDG